MTNEEMEVEYNKVKNLLKGDIETEIEKEQRLKQTEPVSVPDVDLGHPDLESMTETELKAFLDSRNFDRKRSSHMKLPALKLEVSGIMHNERLTKKKIIMGMNKPKLTRQLHVGKKMKKPLSRIPEKLSFTEAKSLLSEFSFPSEMAPSVTEVGLVYYDMLRKLPRPEGPMDVKIIAWKYDDQWDAFLIKRISGLVQHFKQVRDIFFLPTHDIAELADLLIINHSKSQKGWDAQAVIFDKAKQDKREWSEAYDAAPEWRKKDILPQRKEKKRRIRLVEKEAIKDTNVEEALQMMSFPNISTRPNEGQSLLARRKSISGSMTSYPITKWYYNTKFFELTLERNSVGKKASTLRLFSAYETKLLDPSYIQFLDRQLFDKVTDGFALKDMSLFVHMIKTLCTIYEARAVARSENDMLLTKKNISNVTGMYIDDEGYLMIQSSTYKPIQFKSKEEVAIIKKKTLEKLVNIPIDFDSREKEGPARFFAALIKYQLASYSESVLEEQATKMDEQQVKYALDAKLWGEIVESKIFAIQSKLC